MSELDEVVDAVRAELTRWLDERDAGQPPGSDDETPYADRALSRLLDASPPAAWPRDDRS